LELENYPSDLREIFRCSPANSEQILRSTVADVQQLLEQVDARDSGPAGLSIIFFGSSFVNPVNAAEVISMNFSELVEAGAMSLPCSLKLLNDQNLVVRAKAGDTAAFVEFGERHSTRVRRTLYRITRNWEDAEDALQKPLLKAFRHLNGFENRSSFSSWLTRIAINSALMTLRKRRACKEVSIDVVGDDYEIFGRWEPHDISEDPERRYARV
jgi:hypothetical protein